MVEGDSTNTADSSAALAEALQKLARGQKQDLAGLLTDVEVHAQLDNTKVINGGAIIDHEAPRKRQFVAVKK